VGAQCTLLAAPGPLLRCDHTAVGVLITGSEGRVLLGGPAGLPCAWHLRAGHAGAAMAARAVAARFGAGGAALQLTEAGGWRADRCDLGAGHRWRIYAATVTRPPDPRLALAPAARWAGRGELQELAGRAVARACGQTPDSGPGASCPIDPVWLGFLARLGLIQLSPWALTAADCLARTGQPITPRAISTAGPPTLATGQGTPPHRATTGWPQ
jgi:hypothetical protein